MNIEDLQDVSDFEKRKIANSFKNYGMYAGIRFEIVKQEGKVVYLNYSLRKERPEFSLEMIQDRAERIFAGAGLEAIIKEKNN